METKDWYKLTFLIESDSEEIIIWKLNDLGILSFSFEYLIKNENKKEVNIWLPIDHWDESSRSGFEKIISKLLNINPSKNKFFDWSIIKEEDWLTSWKKYWAPELVGNHFLILPCWINLNKKFKDLKKNAVIGTSSYRRQFQIKKIRPDVSCKLIRGNVDTRIKKLADGEYDAIILSYAGIKYLKLEDKISDIFSIEEIIPSAGQGIIAIQCRENDEDMISMLKKINHIETYKRAHAERNILKILEGDCETAVGIHSKIDENKITVEAELFSLDGSQRFYEKKSDKLENFRELGNEIGQILKTKSNNSYKR